MVWLGGPRRRSTRGLGGGLYLNDPPPGYRPPHRRFPLKERQRIARQEWILEHVLAVVLTLVAAALLIIIVLMIATH